MLRLLTKDIGVCAVVKPQTFAQGFIEGWHSVVGAGLHFPEIPSPSIQKSGSEFIRGVMQGIEAAKEANGRERVVENSEF